MRFLILVLAGCTILGCRPGVVRETSDSARTVLGTVDRRLKEASGLVASINNSGLLWTVNDSGNPAEVFLIDRQARIRMVCKLAGINNRDWEDITVGKGRDGKSYLYVADIGDNFSQYEDKLIYRFEEPVLSLDEEQVIEHFDSFVLRLPDGKRDAETILMDPLTHDLYILSKQEGSLDVYRAPALRPEDTLVFEKMMTIPIGPIVGGNISVDGSQVLLKNYNNIYYWKKTKGESLLQLLATTPKVLPYESEPQGEAIAWSEDGKYFYTLSESLWGNHASLFQYELSNELILEAEGVEIQNALHAKAQRR